MPKRDQTFRCFCELCRAGPLGPDGEPLGVVLPVSQRVAHLARVKAEHQTLVVSSSPPPADLDAAVFAQALIDTGPHLNSHASRLWTSRNDYQHMEILSSGSPNISEGNIGSILESFERMANGASISHLVDQTDTFSDVPSLLQPASSSAPNVSSSTNRRENKRERNNHTKKAHRTLDHVERGTKSCLEGLTHVKSNTKVKQLEVEVALLRETFEGVTRRVPSVDKRRATIQQLLLEVDAKVQELQENYPSPTYGPFEYDTSVSALNSNFVVSLTIYVLVRPSL